MRTFKIYVKNECPYCVSAQALLEKKGYTYDRVASEHNQELLLEVQDRHSWSTVPVIFETTNGTTRFIGGYSDLVTYLQKDKQLLRG